MLSVARSRSGYNMVSCKYEGAEEDSIQPQLLKIAPDSLKPLARAVLYVYVGFIGLEYSQACIYHCALESEIPAFSSETEGREVASCKKNRQFSQAQPPISFYTTSDI